MSERITGWNAETLKNLTTGAGVCFENFKLDTDTFETGKKMGATTGGVKIAVEYPDTWVREIDGLPENTKGLHELEFVKPTVEVSFVEVASASLLKQGLGTGEAAAVETPAGYTKVTPRGDIAPEDYLENITIFTQTKGTQKPLIIVIKNPLNAEGFEFETKSKEGGAIKMTYVGCFDPMNLKDMPVEVYTPNAGE